MNDGLVSNFSLVMGVAGGTNENSIVILAGVAGLVAGAFSMASGEWISIRSQRELYENELRIEREELRAFPQEEREELEMIYRAKGVAPEAARSLVDNIMRRSDVALDTLAREELGLDPNQLGSPWVAAISSFLAFAVGAAIPLVPFLIGSGTAATIAAAVISVLALFAAGAATSIFTGRHAGRAGLRMAVIGAVVAAITFGIGTAVGTTPVSGSAGAVVAEVEEAVALVAERDAGVAQGDVPVAGAPRGRSPPCRGRPRARTRCRRTRPPARPRRGSRRCGRRCRGPTPRRSPSAGRRRGTPSR